MKISIVVLVAVCISQGNGQHLLGALLHGAQNVVHGVVGTAHNVVQGVVGTAQNAIGNVIDRPGNVCSRDVLRDYRKSQKSVYTTLFKQVASHTDNHFVFSPYNIWLSLAALAEGSDPSIKNILVNRLYLPQESCLRTKYYYIALNTEQSGRDVTLETKRQLVLNEGSIVNPSWQDAMRAEGLMDIDYADIGATLASFPQPKAGSANSIVTDYFNYKGLWQTAFPSASIQRERFYDEQGRHIGEVNMMRIKMKASLAHLPFMDSKALVLPVGVDGRYKMLITLGIGHNPIRNMISTFMGAILQIFSLLKTSLVPIEIAIPQIEMTSEFDVRPLLEDMGFDALFNDPAATTFVSQPPALPAVLTQHVRVDIGPNGINPPPRREITNPISGLFNIASNIGTGLAAAVGHDFIANKPFLFALYDTKSDTCLFAGAYARPSI